MAQDRLAVGMARTGRAVLHRHVLRLVLALGQLLEHHLTLHGEGVALQTGPQHQIQQQIEGLRRPGGGDQHVVVDIVESGGRVAAAAEGFHPPVEFPAASSLGSP